MQRQFAEAAKRRDAIMQRRQKQSKFALILINKTLSGRNKDSESEFNCKNVLAFHFIMTFTHQLSTLLAGFLSRLINKLIKLLQYPKMLTIQITSCEIKLKITVWDGEKSW